MGERLPLYVIERYLQFQPQSLQDLLLEARSLVFKTAPHATEHIAWGGLLYHDADVGGPVKGAICDLSIQRDHLHVGFIHGAFLPDPAGLLQGDRKSRRGLDLDSLENAPWAEFEALVAAAAEYIQRWR
jgi:hypothetical protein